jgi:hypothetical protein
VFVYPPRAEELQILGAFQVHRTPIIYGDYGVGKTSTILKLAQQSQEEWKDFYFDVAPQDEFADFIKGFLEKEGYTVTKTVREASAETGGTFLSLLTAKAQGKIQQHRELLVSSPTEDKVLDLMNVRKRIIIIDELHKASPRFKECLADFAKSLINRRLRNVRLAMVGTVHQPFEMVKYDEGINRIVQEVRIPPMLPAESRYLITQGMGKCEVLIARELVERIVDLSGGLPSLIHDLCLSCAVRAQSDGTGVVTSSYLNQAVDEVLEKRYGRYHEAWQRVVERTGLIRWRKQILSAMASLPDGVISTEQISAKLAENLGRYVRSSNYTQPMKELQEKHGIIARVPGRRGEEEFALWTFRDPSFKAFIKFLLRKQNPFPHRTLLSSFHDPNDQ